MQPYLEEAVRASHLPYLLMMSSVTGQLPEGNGAQGGGDSLLLSQSKVPGNMATHSRLFYKMRHFSTPGVSQLILTRLSLLCVYLG